jgi:hypothetical protein
VEVLGGGFLKGNGDEGTGSTVMAVDSQVREDQYIGAALMAAMVATERGQSKLPLWWCSCV